MKQHKHINKLFCLAIALLITLTVCPEQHALALSESDTGEENARIEFITQEYIGDNIAEIPYIAYDGDMNPEIDSINRSLNQGIWQIYDNFMTNAEEYEWIEIKSYPFTSDEYLQVVVTYNIYPTCEPVGSMFSINYDKESKRWVSVYDILDELGLDLETLTDMVNQLFEPKIEGQYISNANPAGFLYRSGPEANFVQLLLEVTVENPGSEPWTYFYSYTPESGELLLLNDFCLFDPYDMDWMDPPLSYQEYEEYYDEWGASSDGPDNGDIPYWDGLDFGPNLEYAEEYQLMGDPGEYLNSAEAAKLTFYTMKEKGNIPDYSDDTGYIMTLIDLADIEGEECYVYRLDIDGSDTLGAAYAYAYQSGNIYMQGQMGIWVIPG